jgi:hypothetical protein
MKLRDLLIDMVVFDYRDGNGLSSEEPINDAISQIRTELLKRIPEKRKNRTPRFRIPGQPDYERMRNVGYNRAIDDVKHTMREFFE